MASQWMPRINQIKCTGCGDCIAVCPTGALGWQNGKATLLNPELCTYCAACEEVCLVAAIELPYMILKWGQRQDVES
jgi:NAD-dependent dihydropyrimidine dehydrogenase PreA subunit